MMVILMMLNLKVHTYVKKRRRYIHICLISSVIKLVLTINILDSKKMSCELFIYLKSIINVLYMNVVCASSSTLLLLLFHFESQELRLIGSYQSQSYTLHDTDMSTLIIILENKLIECNYMCQCRINVTHVEHQIRLQLKVSVLRIETMHYKIVSLIVNRSLLIVTTNADLAISIFSF